MFGGYFTSAGCEPISDFGAKRVLGMGGSLMGYIQTGNPYNKKYYKKGLGRDVFVSKRQKTEKCKKIGAAALGAAAVIGSTYMLFKSGKVSEALTSVLSKVKSVPAGVSGAFGSIGEKAGSLLAKFKH